MADQDYGQMQRRRVTALLAAGLAVAAGGWAPVASAKAAPRKNSVAPRALVKPPRLKRGDLVGLIAPGSAMEDAGLQKCVTNLEALGMRVKLSTNVRAQHGNYAGTVQQRLDDIHAMFGDPEIKAVWTARGGHGCIGLLPFLDYAMIRNNAKILVGYSDITALHLAIYRQAGLVTFHAPVAWSTFTEYSVQHLQNVLIDPQPQYLMQLAQANRLKGELDPAYVARAIHHGVVDGPLIGGNLSLVAALAGTPYAADFGGAIAFLEEIEEAPHRVARMLAQLELAPTPASGLEAAAALMLGVFEKCDNKPGQTALSLRDTLDEHMNPLRIPSVAGYSFGHIANQFTLPVGVNARLDSYNQTLTLLEPAVS